MQASEKQDLGQNTTIEELVDSRGRASFRVCRGGICRLAKDRYDAFMYAEHFGWKPDAA